MNYLTPYSNFFSIKIEPKENYSVQVLTSNGWVDIESASGGERSIAILALRIAFSLAFTENLRWLILDEPTHNLDDLSIKKFSEFLRERIGDMIEQVFIITHEKELVDTLSGRIYEFNRNKDIDEPTKVRIISS